MQSRTVGTRIATILQEQEAEEEAEAAAAAANSEADDRQHQKRRKRRRYRIVIHSSPFLRCMQTSIAISAGLASTPFPSVPSASTTTTIAITPDPKSIHARQDSSSGPIHTPGRLTVSTSAPHSIPRSILRLDSFLGEWLSPDYFDHITPPPRSMLMLATAKAELLRREDYSKYPHFHTHYTHHASGGHLWSAGPGAVHRLGIPLASSVHPPNHNIISPGADSLSSLHSGSLAPNGTTSWKSDYNKDVRGDHPHPASEYRGYISPVPSYAVSSSQPIPHGYVAHARDACVDVDYQWDSTRDNLGWGDGGVLPEEWASMHQRFRRGLKRLVEWYTTSENPGGMVTKTPTSATWSGPKASDHHDGEDSDDDVEIENVVVLVSHGAGCNALVGAITQQPVLADVAMSSLTMAQRRPEFDDAARTSDYGRRLSSLDEGLVKKRIGPSDMFELKLFANTDHLLSNLPRNMPVSRSASLKVPQGGPGGLFVGGGGGGGGTYTSTLRDISFGEAYGGGLHEETRRNSANASLGSMRRAPQGPAPVMPPVSYTRPINMGGGVTVGSGATSFLTHRPSRSGSIGLWQPKQERESENSDTVAPVMLLNFSHEKEAAAATTAEQAEAEEAVMETEPTKTDQGLDEQQQGQNGTAAAAQSQRRRTTEEKEHQQQQQQQQQQQTQKKSRSSSHGTTTTNGSGEERDTFGEDDVAVPSHLWAGTGSGGLWGAPRPPGEAERLRDHSAVKRRWTVNER